MKIGDIKLKNNFLLAPMAGVTDIGFRFLCSEHGAALTYTEMISGKGLVYNNANTKQLAATLPSLKPCAVQLFGCQPEILADAVKHPVISSFDIVDLNMGCPMPKIVKCGEGGAMMKDVENAKKVVAACVKNASRPVTVKFRSGWNSDSVNAVDFAKMCEDAGAAAVCLHARTVDQKYTGNVDLNLYGKVADAIKIPLIASGAVYTPDDLNYFANTSVAAFMIGRAALGTPQIFSQLLGTDIKFSVDEMIMRHIGILEMFFPAKLVALNIKKHIGWYIKGMPDNKLIKNKVNVAQDLDSIKNIVKEYLTQK